MTTINENWKNYCGELLILGAAGAGALVSMNKQDKIVHALTGAGIIGATAGGISRIIGVDESLRKTATAISYLALGCLAISLVKDGMSDSAFMILGELVSIGTAAHTTFLTPPY